MNIDEIRRMQATVGTKVDGIWGPLSKAACIRYLRGLMPTPYPFPSQRDDTMREFYGREGTVANLVGIDVSGLGVQYDGKSVSSIRCHRIVSDSLLAIIRELSASPHASILRDYAGCYNHRTMRGGSRPSKHSWGVAIDLAPATNGLRTPWPAVANMPLAVMEIFARHGWVSAGAFWGRDAMHFEACRNW